MIDDDTHLYVSGHSLIRDKLSRIRDRDCTTFEFRRVLRELGILLGYEVTRSLPSSIPMKEKDIMTPTGVRLTVNLLEGQPPLIVPILRAGLVLAEGLSQVLPNADFGFLGLHRDEETYTPIEYMVKISPPARRFIIIVDPMIATGGSALHALALLKEMGAIEENIRFMTVLASFYGLARIRKEFPLVDIFAASVDGDSENNSGLNEKFFIIPGLGDAGDRVFTSGSNLPLSSGY